MRQQQRQRGAPTAAPRDSDLRGDEHRSGHGWREKTKGRGLRLLLLQALQIKIIEVDRIEQQRRKPTCRSTRPVPRERREQEVRAVCMQHVTHLSVIETP